MNNKGKLGALVLLSAAWAGAQPEVAEPFADGSWTLLRLTDAQGTLDLAGETNAPTLSLVGTRFSTAEGTQVSGSTGCNTFRGTGVFTATTLRLTPLATTRRACTPEQSALEARFLNVLSRARGLSFRAKALVLSTGKERLVFGNRVTALEQSRLFAQWRLVGGVGDQALTLRLDAQGRASGSTGCNSFSGTYTLDGRNVRFSPLASTRRACLGAELNAQEQDYLRRLGEVRSYAVAGSVLTLTLENGTTMTFQRPTDGG